MQDVPIPEELEGQTCHFCGEPAAHLLREVLFSDSANLVMPEYLAFLCDRHFTMVMLEPVAKAANVVLISANYLTQAPGPVSQSERAGYVDDAVMGLQERLDALRTPVATIAPGLHPKRDDTPPLLDGSGREEVAGHRVVWFGTRAYAQGCGSSPMRAVKECAIGCCTDYICATCKSLYRVEWPR